MARSFSYFSTKFSALIVGIALICNSADVRSFFILNDRVTPQRQDIFGLTPHNVQFTPPARLHSTTDRRADSIRTV